MGLKWTRPEMLRKREEAFLRNISSSGESQLVNPLTHLITSQRTLQKSAKISVTKKEMNPYEEPLQFVDIISDLRRKKSRGNIKSKLK